MNVSRLKSKFSFSTKTALFRRLEFRVAENHWRSNPPSLVEEVDADGGGLGLPLEGEVLDVLRLVPHHRYEGVLVQEVAFQRQHRVVLVAMLLQSLSELSQ